MFNLEITYFLSKISNLNISFSSLIEVLNYLFLFNIPYMGICKDIVSLGEEFIMKIIISGEAKENLSMMGKNAMTIYAEAVGSC